MISREVFQRGETFRLPAGSQAFFLLLNRPAFPGACRSLYGPSSLMQGQPMGAGLALKMGKGEGIAKGGLQGGPREGPVP